MPRCLPYALGIADLAGPTVDGGNLATCDARKIVLFWVIFGILIKAQQVAQDFLGPQLALPLRPSLPFQQTETIPKAYDPQP